jgi:hypothetical protein
MAAMSLIDFGPFLPTWVLAMGGGEASHTSAPPPPTEFWRNNSCRHSCLPTRRNLWCAAKELVNNNLPPCLTRQSHNGTSAPVTCVRTSPRLKLERGGFHLHAEQRPGYVSRAIKQYLLYFPPQMFP